MLESPEKNGGRVLTLSSIKQGQGNKPGDSDSDEDNQLRETGKKRLCVINTLETASVNLSNLV